MCFLDTDMRCQHDGLSKIAIDNKLNVHKLKHGEHAVFINRSKNRIKMLSHGGVLSYLKLKRGEVLDLNTLKYIPAAFNDSGDLKVSYSNALKKVVKGRI